jgi:hypothetical protein
LGRGTFRKTAAGQIEIERRALGLRPELRRLLIMIDGKRSMDGLATLVRANELSTLLDELLAYDMIEATETPSSFLPVGMGDVNDRQPLTPHQFKAACDAAIAASRELLVADAKPYIAKISKCQDSQALRLVVSEVQLALIGRLGEDAATIFVDAIRSAARNAARNAA